MPVPWIHILGVPFPVPFILMMWIITVATITFYAVSEIKVEAQRAVRSTVCSTSALVTIHVFFYQRDANIEDGFEQNEFDWAGPDCLQFNNPGDYWSYRWCHEQSVAQLRYDKTYTGIEAINAIDMFLPDQSSRHEEYIEQWFISTQSDCVPLNSQDGVPKQRTAVATIYCCEDQPLTPQHLIAGISEPQPCHYRFDICALDMCGVLPATLVHIDSTNSFVEANTIKKSSKSGMQKLNWKKQKTQPAEEAPPASKSQSRRDISSKKISLSMFADRPLVDSEMQGMLRERAKQMFIHGYDAYMNNAFPNVSDLLHLFDNYSNSLFCVE